MTDAVSDTELDAFLSLWRVPENEGLADRIFAKAVLSDKIIMVLFWKSALWLSVVMTVGGFFLGSYEASAEAVDAEQYLESLYTYGV